MKRKITNYAWMGEIYQRDNSNILSYLYNLKEKGIDGIIYRSDRDEFNIVAEKAKSIGMLVEAWYPTLICVNKDISKIDKKLFAVNKNEQSAFDTPPYVDYYRWLCPNSDDVFTLIKSEIHEILKSENVDSVHLDYIRYCDIYLPKGLWPKYNLVMDKVFNEFDFCYCETCRKKFKDQYGLDPIEISEEDPDYKKWITFRLESINKLVLKIKKIVHDSDREISAAVFPGPEIAKNNVLQDWSKWDLDRYFPMNYNTFYLENGEWIGNMVKNEVNSTTKNIISGIYLNNIKFEDFQNGILSSINNGATGIGIFVPEEMNEKHWSFLKKVIS